MKTIKIFVIDGLFQLAFLMMALCTVKCAVDYWDSQREEKSEKIKVEFLQPDGGNKILIEEEDPLEMLDYPLAELV